MSRDKNKKKYLQSCGLTGSLYGRGNNAKVPERRSGVSRTGNLTSSYSKLYRDQVNAMTAVFGKKER